MSRSASSPFRTGFMGIMELVTLEHFTSETTGLEDWCTSTCRWSLKVSMSKVITRPYRIYVFPEDTFFADFILSSRWFSSWPIVLFVYWLRVLRVLVTGEGGVNLLCNRKIENATDPNGIPGLPTELPPATEPIRPPQSCSITWFKFYIYMDICIKSHQLCIGRHIRDKRL